MAVDPEGEAEEQRNGKQRASWPELDNRSGHDEEENTSQGHQWSQAEWLSWRLEMAEAELERITAAMEGMEVRQGEESAGMAEEVARLCQELQRVQTRVVEQQEEVEEVQQESQAAREVLLAEVAALKEGAEQMRTVVGRVEAQVGQEKDERQRQVQGLSDAAVAATATTNVTNNTIKEYIDRSVDALRQQLQNGVDHALAELQQRLLAVEARVAQPMPPQPKVADPYLTQEVEALKERVAKVERAAATAIQPHHLTEVVAQVQRHITSIRDHIAASEHTVAQTIGQVQHHGAALQQHITVSERTMAREMQQMRVQLGEGNPPQAAPASKDSEVSQLLQQLVSLQLSAKATHTTTTASTSPQQHLQVYSAPPPPQQQTTSASTVATCQPKSRVRPELRLVKAATIEGGGGGVTATGPIVVGSARVSGQAMETANINRVQVAHIAPVVAGGMVPSAMLPAGLADALIGRDPGKFAGDSASWPQWRKRWQQYLREVTEMYPAVSNRQKLTLLMRWLDEPSALILQEELERDPSLTYDRYWAKMDLSFGAAGKDQLRRQLRSVRLQTKGKLAERDWSEVYSKITTIAAQLGDVSESEVARLLMDTLPPNPWRRKLAEKEDKRQLRGGLAVEGMPRDTTEEEMAQLLEEETGGRPRSVRQHQGKWRIQPLDDEHRCIIKRLFDRQALQGGAVITVAPDSVELAPREVNELMLRWLRIDQRVAYGSQEPSQEESRREDRRPRYHSQPPKYQREVQANIEEEEWWEEAEESAAVWEVTRAEEGQQTATSSGQEGSQGGLGGRGKGKGEQEQQGGKGWQGGKGKGRWEGGGRYKGGGGYGKGKGKGKGEAGGKGKGKGEWEGGGKGKGEQQE